MQEQRTATYIPFATDRTKNVVKHLQPGSRQTIDAVNVDNIQDRVEVEVWAVEKDDGIHINYTDGAHGKVIELGYADQVRVAIEEASTEE
jgi:hypothetical protein